MKTKKFSLGNYTLFHCGHYRYIVENSFTGEIVAKDKAFNGAVRKLRAAVEADRAKS